VVSVYYELRKDISHNIYVAVLLKVICLSALGVGVCRELSVCAGSCLDHERTEDQIQAP